MSRLFINDNWLFTEQYTNNLHEQNVEGLVPVRIPHTCKEVHFNYFDESIYQMESGYRRVINAPAEWQGKRIFITVDGAAHSAELYLNGRKLNEHHCGYTAFTTELTQDLILGQDNILVIKVDSRENQNIPPFGFVVDYMTFGGIYRDVYLDIKDEDYIKDVFVRASFDKESDLSKAEADSTLISTIELSIPDSDKAAYYIRSYISKDEKRIHLGDTPVESKKMTISKSVKNITLWNINNPFLYTLEYELYKDSDKVDSFVLDFGFREAEFRKDGFFLNRQKTKIRGLNRHQSYPYVGYAMPKSMQIHDAEILKNELGCNAVRTSHYPQSHHFIKRCDEIGLLVFMEFPGWQFIGDDEWKKQACENVKDMISQYRNHTSIILWGVRINESQDDDEFYKQTNAIAHEYDESRQSGGVRCHKNSSMFEDVYTYNDFVHDGTNIGCEQKKNVTSDIDKAYLVSEYNGHMFPTKNFDCEEHRREQALRHAKVLDAITAEQDIAGSFGWCMFDYNTHKDFGSGDRICYHGVMDMFRNPKLASYVYSCQQDKEIVLELSSSMDIGEHPACNRGFTYIFSNADSVKMYKNDNFIKEYTNNDSPYKNLKHGPIIIDDFIGDQLKKNENFSSKQAEIITYSLNYAATHGFSNFPLRIKVNLLKCMLFYHMKPTEAVSLYNKYVGDWGGTSTVYRFDAIKDGKVVKSITKEPMRNIRLEVSTSTTLLKEIDSYDVAELRLKVVDDNNNLMHFYGDAVEVKTEGPIELIGPSALTFRGGMAGLYIKSVKKSGEAKVIIGNKQLGYYTVDFAVSV